ncbi:MAG: MnhB domain-containing protein [Bacillota bacterium]|nr:MnhB domain-containing protein [Bacillota bacterium]
MKNSQILVCISRVLFPFILVFGFYVIVNGHLTPGGGFQGGAILATAILITYFIIPERINIIDGLVRLEKHLFLWIIVVGSLSLITKGTFFTNPFPIPAAISLKRIFLVLLNFLIGSKVAIGLIAIFSSFIEEGRS